MLRFNVLYRVSQLSGYELNINNTWNNVAMQWEIDLIYSMDVFCIGIGDLSRPSFDRKATTTTRNMQIEYERLS